MATVGNGRGYAQRFAPLNKTPNRDLTDVQRSAHALADRVSADTHAATNIPVDREGHQGKDEHYQMNA